MSAPEIIYLIPGEDIEGYPGMVWCDDPAPDSYSDPYEAVKYVRADIHESALKRQGTAAKMGMDAAKKDTSWREENARRLLAESNPAALESERAMNANLTGEVERLQSRVAAQQSALNSICTCSWGRRIHPGGSDPMKPTNNHDQALRASDRSVQEAGERLVNLQRRISDGARMPAGTVSNAARVESRTTLSEAAAVFEFVGRFDDYAENDRLTLNEIREAAHQFARDQRG